jgi:hypothetical protein
VCGRFLLSPPQVSRPFSRACILILSLANPS